MRLDFNLLWVEDQQNLVENQRNRMQFLMEREGFRLQVKFAASIVEAMEVLSDNIYGDHIDMIVMDYDLGSGMAGDEGLLIIRNTFAYKDIVFYSAQANNLIEKVAGKKVQGIYCSSRDDLPDTVQGVFESLIRKVLDIDHARGIVMGATSYIDHFINDCLITLFNCSNETCQTSTLQVLGRHIQEKRTNLEKNLKELECLTNLSSLSDKHAIYTSYDRIRLLVNILQINQIHAEKVVDLKNYMVSTLPKRNDLAHIEVKIDGFSRKLIDRNGNEFSSDDMKSLRLELINYQTIIEDLLDDIKRQNN